MTCCLAASAVERKKKKRFLVKGAKREVEVLIEEKDV